MDIIGIKINAADARKDKELPVTGVDFDIRFTSLKATKGEIQMEFLYSVNYRPKIGYLKMFGTVMAKDTPKTAKKLVDEWKKKKQLPKEVGEPVLNLINMSASINGVLVARSINLPSPVYPPKIVVEGETVKT